VCRDKISCPPQQLNGGCIEGYCLPPDRPTLIAHSHGPAEREARYNEGV